MSLLKRKYILWVCIVCLTGILLPFLFKEKSDSLISVLSLSFTIIGTILSVIALIVALLLFDRFGLTAKFKEKQVDKVIELATLLKETNITASTNKMDYYVHATQSSEAIRNSVPFYKADASKTILFPGNFEHLIKEIYLIRDNYWFPEEIKKKMKVLEIYGIVVIDNPLDEQYVRLDFNRGSDGTWAETIPKITFEMFNINLHNLFLEIESWLRKHSDIIPNFKFSL